ncbi:unnamed protein product, partial [Ceratitis capitata]
CVLFEHPQMNWTANTQNETKSKKELRNTVVIADERVTGDVTKIFNLLLLYWSKLSVNN